MLGLNCLPIYCVAAVPIGALLDIDNARQLAQLKEYGMGNTTPININQVGLINAPGPHDANRTQCLVLQAILFKISTWN